MTARRKPPVPQTPGQLDMFTGAPSTGLTIPTQRGPLDETNGIDLVQHVAGNAGRGLYLIVGASDRVYARADGAESRDVVRVPRYEEQAVHQLLTRGWLTLGGRHDVTCGAASLVGTAVLCPKTTTARVRRWEALVRPTSWPTPATPPRRPDLRVVKGDRT